MRLDLQDADIVRCPLALTTHFALIALAGGKGRFK